MDNNVLLERVNKREIYRYLGYRGQLPDDNICHMVDEVLEELIMVINPRNIYRYYKCEVNDNYVRLWKPDRPLEGKCDIEFISANLAANIKGCKMVVVFAATLGVEADKLLYKYEIINMAKASVVQACGAACIEAYCNILSDEIRINSDGLYLRPRFSPGYGDLSLEAQKIIFDNLECPKRLGLTLTDSLLMYPTKSVTAIIGLTKDENGCHINGCTKCGKKDCEFRNED